MYKTVASFLTEKDFALANNLIKNVTVRDEHDCTRFCFSDPGCLSFNYEYAATRMKTCELNNSTNELDYESFVNKPGFVYLA